MEYYCFWDAKSFEDAIIILIIASFVFLIFLFTIYQAFRSLKYFDKKILKIYIVIFLWQIASLAQHGYSLIIYFLQLNGKENVKQFALQSKIYNLLDSVPSFLIQTLFLIINYTLVSNTHLLSQEKKNILSQTEPKKKVYLLRYIWIRSLFYAAAYGGIIYSDPMENTIKIASLSRVIILISDSLISNIIFWASFRYIFSQINQFKLAQTDQEKRKMKREYALMVSTSSFRFIFDLIFLVLFPISNDQSQNCINPLKNHLTYTIFYLIFGNITCHFLPIITILKFYKAGDQEVNSLLSSQKITIRSKIKDSIDDFSQQTDQYFKK